MMDRVPADHLSRQAFVYIRRSTPDQLRHNHESRRRPYGLAVEAPRPARNGGNCHMLSEFFGLVGSLLADEDGVHDPRPPNDVCFWA